MLEPFLYSEALNYVKGFEKSKIKLGLERIQKGLKAFNLPQNSFKSIHIAGTNGKGSVGAFLDSLLAGEGNFVGRFCSPHLITPRERILIDGKPITRQWFAASVSILRDKIEEFNLELSYFEFFTLLAFYIFSFLKVDYGIIETGLGGRLDSTNTIEHPEVVIITSLSYDHTRFLGETMASIAGEKAGIVKPGIPVITSARGEALEILKTVCLKKSAPLFSLEDIGFTFEMGKVCVKQFDIEATLPLMGSFQAENLALALVAFHFLTKKKGDFSDSIKNTVWPARLESFSITENKNLIVDGAHNLDALTRVIGNLEVRENEVCVFGCMKDKSVKPMLDVLRKRFKKIVLTAGDFHRFAKEDYFREIGAKEEFATLDKIVNYLSQFENIYILGSLHLAGDILKTIVEDGRFKDAIVKKEPYCYIFDSSPY